MLQTCTPPLHGLNIADTMFNTWQSINGTCTFSLSFSKLVVIVQSYTSKFHKWSPFINSRRLYMAEILPIRRKTLLWYNQSINQSFNPCADLEGGSGGSGPPWNLQSLISPILLAMKKNCYFSYLCTSTVIRQGWTPPEKIFWIRACNHILQVCPTLVNYLEKNYMCQEGKDNIKL